MSNWSAHLPVYSVRIARHTHQFQKIVEFYRDLIGLPEIGSFSEHDRYDGIMLGLPGQEYHLEFTTHPDSTPASSPSRDNLLVFYINNQKAIAQIVERLREGGYRPVKPENPYWAKGGVTFEDPDGWGVVFMNMIEHRRIINAQADEQV